MGEKDPNPKCCYKPDVIVTFEEERISLESKKKYKIAKCPNCGETKEVMDTEIIHVYA